MSRRGKRTSIGEQFFPRIVSMLGSPAYRTLSLSALRVLTRIEIEMMHHGGTDNGKLPVTYNQFVEYGVHRHCIGPSIREAVALGFLLVTEKGQAGNADFRRPNKFLLTYAFATNVKPTHDWQRIETLERAEAIAREARKPVKRAKKNRKPVPETITETRVGNHHRKSKSPVPEIITTGQGTEIITTSISWGGGRSPGSSERGQGDQPASVSEHDPASDF